MMAKILMNKVRVDKGEPPIPIYSVAGLEKRKSSKEKWRGEETEAFYEGVSQYSKLGFNINMWRAILGDVKYGPILKNCNISSLNNKYLDDKKKVKKVTVEEGASATEKKGKKVSAAFNNKKKGEKADQDEKKVFAAVEGFAIDKKSEMITVEGQVYAAEKEVKKVTVEENVEDKKVEDNLEEGKKVTFEENVEDKKVEENIEKEEDLLNSEEVKESLTIKEIYALVARVVTAVVQSENKKNEDAIVERVAAQVVATILPIIERMLKDNAINKD